MVSLDAQCQYDQWDGHSPDAARWADGEWIDERKPGPTAWVDELQELQQRVSAIALGSSPQRVMFGTPEESEWPNCDHSLYQQLFRMAASLCEYPPRLCPTCRTEMLDPRERQLQYFRWVQARRQDER